MNHKASSFPKGPSLEVEKLISLYGNLALHLRIQLSSASDPRLRINVTQGSEVHSVALSECTHFKDSGKKRAVGNPALTSKVKSLPNEVSHLLEERRYLIVIPRDSAERFNLNEPVRVSLEPSKSRQGVTILPRPASLFDLLEGVGAKFAPSLEGAGFEAIAAILGAPKLSIKPLETPKGFWLERMVSSGTGLVVNGWMANFAARTIHVVSGDLRTWLFNRSIKMIQRPDVHAHLRVENLLTGTSDEHGFTFVLPQHAEGTEELYFVEVEPSGRSVTFHGPLPVKADHNEALALDIVRQAYGDIRSLTSEEVDTCYRPLLSTAKGDMQAQVFDFGPALRSDKPISSIIIPFYGDAFFLNCAHYLQRVLDDSFELVIVVDDLRIWGEIYNGLALRSSGFRVPTRLLRNIANYGYGGANNLAASLARGDVLFLMNSDILVKDARGLVLAAEAIRDRKRTSRPDIVVGFSLLYEDETVQHVGMEFTRSSLMGNLFVADHPMKGLPFALYSGAAIKSVPAVTAALMGISKDFFVRLGGFDLRYERGDFEDADLCLKARQAGGEIQLHVQPGLYHLERQSIPAMGDADVRAMVTYMNCAEFNRRWSSELSRPKRIFKVAGHQAATASSSQP